MPAPSLTELLADKTGRAPLLFSPAELAGVSALLNQNSSGKPVVRCQVRGKDVAAKPEELVRQLWLYRLIHHYAYPTARLAVEYPVTFGRDTSKRADIVIMDADRPTVPYAIVEVKALTLKGGKDQLKSYTHATGAPANGSWPTDVLFRLPRASAAMSRRSAGIRQQYFVKSRKALRTMDQSFPGLTGFIPTRSSAPREKLARPSGGIST